MRRPRVERLPSDRRSSMETHLLDVQEGLRPHGLRAEALDAQSHCRFVGGSFLGLRREWSARVASLGCDVVGLLRGPTCALGYTP